MQDYNYSKWELEDLNRNRDIVTHRITELESVLIELYKVSKNVQDLLIRVDHRLLMDSDFGRAITVLSSDLGDNVLRLKYINDEISKKSVTIISGDGCTPIHYDANGNRIYPAYVFYPFAPSMPIYVTGDFPLSGNTVSGVCSDGNISSTIPPGNLDADGNCIGKDWPKSGSCE